MQNSAAFTICAINYLPKALVLFESYRRHHPDHAFYIVLVDRKAAELVIDRPGLTVIWVEDLGVENFRQHAFAFDVIELSTNVKPASLLYLLSRYDVALYIDPDIKIYAPLEPVFSALQTASVVVTPHTNLPVIDGNKPDDGDLAGGKCQQCERGEIGGASSPDELRHATPKPVFEAHNPRVTR